MAHPEALLISALINNGDVLAAEQLGVSPGHFHEYKAEYEWLIDTKIRYKAEPSYSAFKGQFEDFVLLEHQDVHYAAEQVHGSHLKSQLAKTARELTSQLRTKSPDEVLDAVQSSIFKIASGYDAGVQVSNSVKDYSASLDYALTRDSNEGVMGIPFFHGTLRAHADSQKEGDFTVFAARLNHGKSWLLINEAAQAVLGGKKVLYYSLEMTKRAMEYRFQVIWAQLLGFKDFTHSMLDKGRGLDLLAYKGLLAAIAEQVPGELLINDTSRGGITPQRIAADINRHHPDLVVIDHLSLMGGSGGTKATEGWQILAGITGELKQVATAFAVPILSASQINREGDNANWRPPKVKNLAQSDSIGQDADNVITMKRYGKGAMVYSLEKNRSGQAGFLWFSLFDPEHGQFQEITKDRADDIKSAEEFVED
jgi:replicative DNA helicase